MSSTQHVLERRSTLLAQRLRQRIDDTVLALQAAGGRIPFKTKLSRGDALEWWAKHRYDALGQQALQSLSPLDVAQLDNALSKNVAAQTGGLPIISGEE